MRIDAEIELDDFIEQLNHDSAREAIIQIDKAMADVDFTLDIINHLINDLKQDPEFNINQLDL